MKRRRIRSNLQLGGSRPRFPRPLRGRGCPGLTLTWPSAILSQREKWRVRGERPSATKAARNRRESGPPKRSFSSATGLGRSLALPSGAPHHSDFKYSISCLRRRPKALRRTRVRHSNCRRSGSRLRPSR